MANDRNLRISDQADLDFVATQATNADTEADGCDVIVDINASSAIAFDKPSVEIEFGQTVCWQWDNSLLPHNVAQVSDSESMIYNSGFYSGSPNFAIDFRVTFDEVGGYSDNTTYYYICEPHVAMGMAGEVVVRSADDSESPFELDDAGGIDTLPSLSLMISISVIGAIVISRRRR
jgi:plastocyanin